MQPVSGYQWTNISGTAAGTATVSPRACTLYSVVIPSTKTGTVTIYDNGAGAGSGKSIEIVNDTVDFPTTVHLGIQMRNGITAISGGTTGLTVVWN